MLCPVCAVDLVITDRQGVEIDFCPSCRGVWLDRGELDKIIERASHYTESRDHHYKGSKKKSKYRLDEPHYEDSDRSRYYNRKKSKKHKAKDFLEEIFDIF